MTNDVKTEFLLDGKKVPYEACSRESKNAYSREHWEYIGSSYTFYINGTINVSGTLHHFFKKKERPEKK